MLRLMISVMVIAIGLQYGFCNVHGPVEGQYSKTGRVSGNKQVAEEPEYFTVTFSVADEAVPGITYEPQDVVVFANATESSPEYFDSCMYPDEWMLELGIGWETMVPAGIYDFILRSEIRPDDIPADDDTLHLEGSYVVFEDVVVAGDMEIQFRQSDAKNRLSCAVSRPDGMGLPEMTSPADEIPMSFGTYRCLMRADGGHQLVQMMVNISQDVVWVNDLSEKWTYAVNSAAMDDSGIYLNLITRDGPFDHSEVFVNPAADYVEVRKPAFPTDLAGQKEGVDMGGITSKLVWNGADWSGDSSAFLQGCVMNSLPLWVNMPGNRNHPEDGWNLVFKLSSGYSYVDYEWTDWEGNQQVDRNYMTFSSPMMAVDEACRLTALPGAYRAEDNSKDMYFPANPPLSYTLDNQEEFFEFKPVIGYDYDIWYDEWADRHVIWLEHTAMFPGLESLDMPGKMVFSYDGSIVETDGPGFDFRDWSYEEDRGEGLGELSVTVPTGDDAESTLELSFINDGQLPGIPHAVRYQLRNSAGNVTDMVSGETILTVEWAGAETLSAEISPSGKSDWIEVALKEVNAGNVLSGVLASGGLESNTDYDLRFTGTVDVSNYSIQTIGHAFRTGGTGGMKAIEPDCPGPTCEGVEWYDVTGKKVRMSEMDRGLYIKVHHGKASKQLR